MIAHAADTTMQVHSVMMLLLRQALTEEPYRKMFSAELLPRIAAAPMMGMPVPMKKLDAMEMPKYRRNRALRKV